jgi:hypothetical protein
MGRGCEGGAGRQRHTMLVDPEGVAAAAAKPAATYTNMCWGKVAPEGFRDTERQGNMRN